METVSAIKPKPGRGRRPLYPSFLRDAVSNWPAKTPRGKQNNMRTFRAMDCLYAPEHGDRFNYLFKPKPRLTILAELGRLPNAETILKFADEVCKERMTKNQTIALCRRARKIGFPSSFGVSEAISRAISQYQERHPEIDPSDIGDALRIIAKSYPES